MGGQLGFKHTEESKRKISRSAIGNTHGFQKGHKPWNVGKGELYKMEKNVMWKGDSAGYKTIHEWINRNFGKPKRCEFCHSIENLDWSNKDHKYKRIREDWQVLCKKCHRKYDKKPVL